MSLKLEQYRGPFPHPETLAAYEVLYPGVSKQIFDDAHRQTLHRIGIEKTAIDGDNFRATAGLFSGLVIALAGLGLSALLVYNGHGGYAVVFATIDLAALVGVFVYGTASRRSERTEKAELMAGEEQHLRRHAELDESRVRKLPEQPKTAD